MKRFRVVVVMFLAAVSLSLAFAPAKSTPPGQNGRIAFRRYLNDDQTRGALFTINPDGTGLRRVTHPRPGVVTDAPDWSSDGRWIAYTRKWEGHRRRIFKIHSNGTGRVSLSGTCTAAVNCIIDSSPAWSPDGTRIAFWRGFGHRPSQDPREADLMVMRADGTGVRKITDHDRPVRYGDFNPQWWPNGKRLVFERFNKDRSRWAVVTIRLDGTGARRLTPWRMDAGDLPDWSPNGRWIVFRSHLFTHIKRSAIWMVHPDGTDMHRITARAGGTIMWFRARFSPNGLRIVVVRAPGVGAAGNPDVYTMNLDGSGLKNVTQSRRWDGTPDWGPRRT